jgi:hypothetical protein
MQHNHLKVLRQQLEASILALATKEFAMVDRWFQHHAMSNDKRDTPGRTSSSPLLDVDVIGTWMDVARAESVDWHDGQSKHVLHLFFLSFASDEGMFSTQFN